MKEEKARLRKDVVSGKLLFFYRFNCLERLICNPSTVSTDILP